MPGFDGTGPQGRGPMTGKAMGFCVLKENKDKPGLIEGLVGIQGRPISVQDCTLQNQPIYFGRLFGQGRRFRGGRNRFGP